MCKYYVCGREVDLLDWCNLLEINRSLSKLFVVPDLKVILATWL